MNSQANGSLAKMQNGSEDSYSAGTIGFRTKRSFKKRDIDMIRIIGQHLRDLGLNKTVEHLITESGSALENQSAAKFRTLILDGHCNEARKLLDDMIPCVNDTKKRLELLLLEQKYLELLDDGAVLEAVQCLRSEIVPLSFCTDSLHKLTSLVMCNSQAELRATAKWEGKGRVSRQRLIDKIQEHLPANVMLPPRRLERLLQQALKQQTEGCLYHNEQTSPAVSTFSLLTDHSCSRDGFPCHVSQTIPHHKDEVWICRFSPDGLKLATGSKDCTVNIYDVYPETSTVGNRRKLVGHANGVAYVSWSPDSKYLAVCGPEDTPHLWVWNIPSTTLKAKVNYASDDSLTCAAWRADSERFFTGGSKGQFYHCDLTGDVVDSWEGVRVQCLQVIPDQPTVLASDTHFRLRGYNFDEMSDYSILQEDHPIMSFSIDNTGRYALVNVAKMGVHLWDLLDRCLIRRYHGLEQGLYNIYSCFGGQNQEFVASGSEDAKVYLWHRQRESPLLTLEGHTQTVNCVHWNPMYSHILVTASDDKTVKIWAPKGNEVVIRDKPGKKKDESSGAASTAV